MPAQALQFSTVARVFGDDLRQVAAAARLAGFEGLQIDAITRAIDLTALSGTGFRELRHILSAQAQRPVALRAETGAEGLGPKADVDRVLDRADGVLRAAAALAVPVVCLDLGRLPPAPKVMKPKPPVTSAMAGFLILPEPVVEAEPEPAATKVDPALVAHWQRAMSALGDIADRYGVMLALASTQSSLASLDALTRGTPCPWFGVDFDPSALLRDEWTADELFDAMGPQIRHVRARDAVGGEGGRTKPAVLGRGDVAWRSILELLDASGYHAAVTVDSTELPDPPAAAVAGLKQLRAILAS
ncbi:MAG TPA: sugar phosphate isomerase/epimerase [Tepidisphaeraceae bacterium]|jgi:sugar phosphate isomerase/epimerase